ncbi:MAG: hypothetical protein DRR00_13315 [Candidatus Parabeggiatoa sp. nov. 3]|nr:MAG: hypothetical protein DRR00_13315 [Gammaproteobacteria bacterium]RKZ65286.1 MAG: hypothetical protein DRQ99_13120 [Gammaproteobacteria bacterium]
MERKTAAKFIWNEKRPQNLFGTKNGRKINLERKTAAKFIWNEKRPQNKFGTNNKRLQNDILYPDPESLNHTVNSK